VDLCVPGIEQWGVELVCDGGGGDQLGRRSGRFFESSRMGGASLLPVFDYVLLVVGRRFLRYLTHVRLFIRLPPLRLFGSPVPLA
jgi:hypothetical protein